MQGRLVDPDGRAEREVHGLRLPRGKGPKVDEICFETAGRKQTPHDNSSLECREAWAAVQQ